MKQALFTLGSSLLAACASAPQPESARSDSAPQAAVVRDGWAPVPGKLMTRWAKDVSPTNARPEYPRPTMVRDRWLNLNGLWDYAIGAAVGRVPTQWDGRILVPYPLESALSGVGRRLAADQTLWYRRTFEVPSAWQGERVLLHFGAVDWSALVTVNGRDMGAHTGGYDGFEFDITDALHAGANELVVAVTDPTDAGGQPRGKQVGKPEGIWYTPSSGIWQTVWLEPVPQTYIRGLRIWTMGARVQVNVDSEGPLADVGDVRFEFRVLHGDRPVASTSYGEFALDEPRMWSPSDPHLYRLEVTTFGPWGEPLDAVTSYFGLRDLRVERGEHGIQRLTLNGQALFQFGPLDQGFWPDGLYTAPTLEALRFDIEAVKKMGGNMLRKHVKVEPELFYAECDRLGVMVWQDMPSANNATPAERANFERELHELVTGRSNHPSIVMWVPFNEGWGQYDTERVIKLEGLDPSRLVNNASGWTDRSVGDVIDVHAYPGPAMAPVETYRASVLGEFGGLGLPIEGHTWVAKDNWGYRTFASQAELTDAYVALLEQLPLLIGQGLSAAVYTQTTDVEIECNGWLTYDREVWKIDPARAAAAAKKLYEPPPRLRVVVPNASNGAATSWRFTTSAPSGEWSASAFDDSAWSEGVAGFGTKGTPGAVIGSEWGTNDIWLRRTFELVSADLGDLLLAIHHDEDAEVFLNGVLAAKLGGYTTSYVIAPLSAEARTALHAGANTLAIHCKQTGGGRYIDAGLVAVE